MTILNTQSATAGFTQLTAMQTGAPVTQQRQAAPAALPDNVAPAAPVTPDLLRQAVDEANQVLSQTRPDIQFVIDDESNKVVIKLIEPESGHVINQYPTEQAVAISHAITQFQTQAAERHAAYESGQARILGLFVKHKT